MGAVNNQDKRGTWITIAKNNCTYIKYKYISLTINHLYENNDAFEYPFSCFGTVLGGSCYPPKQCLPHAQYP